MTQHKRLRNVPHVSLPPDDPASTALSAEYEKWRALGVGQSTLEVAMDAVRNYPGLTLEKAIRMADPFGG